MNNVRKFTPQGEAMVQKVQKDQKHLPDTPSEPFGPFEPPSEGVKPFPVDALPAVVRDMVEAVSESEQVPVVLSVACALGTLSGAIGRGLQVKSAAGRTTRSNLYFIASAESGTGKSSSYKHFMKPLVDAERRAFDEWQETVPKLEANAELTESEIQRLKSAARKDDADRAEILADMTAKKTALAEIKAELVAPRWMVDDITVEALQVKMQRDETMFHASPDARQIVENLLGKHSGGTVDDAVLLKCFEGESCRTDRMGRESVGLEAPVITLLWLIQPDKLDALLNANGLSVGGFLPRCLVCHSRATTRIETGMEGHIDRPVVDRWSSLVTSLSGYRAPRDEGGELLTYTIWSEPEVIATVVEYQHRIAVEESVADVLSFSCRWAEQAWRISAVLHAATHGANAHTIPLAVETARSAIRIAEWYSDKQLDILTGQREERGELRINEIRQVIKRKGEDRKLTMAKLCRRDRFDPREVERLASQFPALLRVKHLQTGGRPSVVVIAPS